MKITTTMEVEKRPPRKWISCLGMGHKKESFFRISFTTPEPIATLGPVASLPGTRPHPSNKRDVNMSAWLRTPRVLAAIKPRFSNYTRFRNHSTPRILLRQFSFFLTFVFSTLIETTTTVHDLLLLTALFRQTSWFQVFKKDQKRLGPMDHRRFCIFWMVYSPHAATTTVLSLQSLYYKSYQWYSKYDS